MINESGRKSELYVKNGKVEVSTRYVVDCGRLNDVCGGSLYPYLEVLKNHGEPLMQMTTVKYDPNSANPYSIALTALRNIIPRLGNDNYRPWWMVKNPGIRANLTSAIEPYDPERHKDLVKKPKSRSKGKEQVVLL